MTSPEDPEERIRQLEQSAAAYGARELGADQPGYGEGVNPASALPPPAYGPPPPYDSQPAYGAPPPSYGDPYQPPFGTQSSPDSRWCQYYTPIQKKGAPVGLIVGMVVVVFVAILGGVAAFAWRMSSTVDEVAGGGGSVDDPTYIPPTITLPSFPSIPSIPSMPGMPGFPSDDTEQTATRGVPISVAGIDEITTVVCQDGDVNISGVNNTVTLTGHCGNVNVSGVENKITVDSADVIGASGFDNQITYLSGDPEVNNTGSNTVSRG